MTEWNRDDDGAAPSTPAGTAAIDRELSEDGLRLAGGQPRRRFHRSRGRQRFSTDETTEETTHETTDATIASSAENAAPDPCNSCTDPSEEPSEGAGAPVYPLPPTPPIRLGDAAPRGPVDGYHPGRLAGVVPNGTLIHTDYDGQLHDFGALRRERRAPTRPPMPRARCNLRFEATLASALRRRIRRGQATYAKATPIIKKLAKSFPRPYPRTIRREDRFEGAYRGAIDRLAGVHPLTTLLEGLARDEDVALWVADRVLRKRYGRDVSPLHLADVAERVLTWEPSGEPMAVDAHEGEFGVPEAFVAIGDVAHVRQEIVRLLMTVAGSARGIIRGRGESALLTLAAAFESGYAATLSLRPGRWFHAYNYSKLWFVTGIAGRLRDLGVNGMEYGPMHQSLNFQRYQGSSFVHMLETEGLAALNACNPLCFAGFASASEAFQQHVSYCLRSRRDRPLIFRSGELVTFRSRADALAGAQRLIRETHAEARGWLDCQTIDHHAGPSGASDSGYSPRSDLPQGPAGGVREVYVPFSPPRVLLCSPATNWHNFGSYRLRCAGDEILIEPSMLARQLFRERLRERLDLQPPGAAEEYVSQWCRSLKQWNGWGPFRCEIRAALPDLRALPEDARREALGRRLAEAFDAHTGRPMVRTEEYRALLAHFRRHGDFPHIDEPPDE